MGLFSLFKKKRTTMDCEKMISARFVGRLDGMVVLLAKEGNIDCSKYNIDDVDTILVTTKVCAAFPEQGKIIEQLVSKISEIRKKETQTSAQENRKQCMLGIVEAGSVSGQPDRPWHLLLESQNISFNKE